MLSCSLVFSIYAPCNGDWIIQTVDSENDVGKYTSLSFDKNGNPGISYIGFDVIKYAYFNGIYWNIEIAGSWSFNGYCDTSLAFDNSLNPAIATIHIPWDASMVRYVFYNIVSWEIDFIDKTSGGYTSLAFDSFGNPAVSYQYRSNPGGSIIRAGLAYAHFDGIDWNIEYIDDSGTTGFYNSLAFDSSGHPGISYYESYIYSPSLGNDLKFACHDGNSWRVETVDSGGNTGMWTSLSFDSIDLPGISYYDKTNGDLKYAHFNGINWDIQTVDSIGNVGEYSSLAYDLSGNPCISYYDRTNNDLKYARFNGSIWEIEVVEAAGDVGSYSSLAFDPSGNPAISYYDATNGDLKFAIWETEIVPNPVISSLSPDSGPIGTEVTISGSNFGSTQGIVTFNGVESSIDSWTDTQIVTTVPSGATSGPVVVHISDGKNSNGVLFTVTISPPEDQPPSCSLGLLRNGNSIDSIKVGELLDIYVGDSTDDRGIKEVRFLSDESQNGIVDPGFTWTKPYDWNNSSDAWDQSSKIMAWSFATSGEKEVWVELQDEMGQVSYCFANITAEWPYPDFAFAHITDVHYGWERDKACDFLVGPLFALDCPLAVSTKFTDTLWNVAHYDPRPEFILITGDNVEYAKKEWFGHFRTLLDEFSMKNSIPVYVVPGNHDRYECMPIFNALEEYFIRGGNDDLQQYLISMETPERLSGVSVLDPFKKYCSLTKSLENGKNCYNYEFPYNGYLFIGLDSGEDYYDSFGLEDGFDFGPEGSGLSSEHREALEKLDPHIPKIIFMHHPVITGEKDGDLEDASIRDRFIDDYCGNKNNHVQMVLSGHTHEDHIFNAVRGNCGVKDWSVGDWRGCTTDCPCPWFVQTPSAVKDEAGFPHGYRIVQIKEGSAYTGKYIPTESVSKKAAAAIGSGILNVYDSQGRHTGFGSTIVDIPDSYYTGYYDSATPQMITLYNTSEDYKYEVVGTSQSTYLLGIVFIENGEAITFAAIDIPTASGSVHQYGIDWGALSQGENGATVLMDSDGDGTFEIIINAGDTFSFVNTTVDIDPNTLNLKSKGKWITVYIEFPEGCDVNNIDLNTIELKKEMDFIKGISESGPSGVGDYDYDNIPDLMVKFDRSSVIGYLKNTNHTSGNITFSVVGKVNNKIFVGTDIIRIYDGKGEHN